MDEQKNLQKLTQEIAACSACAGLALGPRPIIQISINSKILVISQAPGAKAHNSGVPFNDQSGERLRTWMNMDKVTFYNPNLVGIMPMGFCYPGKAQSGDLPPRKECAPLWHQKLSELMSKVELTLLVGNYAHKYYLKDKKKLTLTATVKSFEEYAPKFPLVHPSPLNLGWLKKNPWYEAEVIPSLQQKIKTIIGN
jgi:uracil-DNA glycosylase